MRKVLFLDRDGTLINEPQPSQQVDSLEKLEFIPGVFQYLSRLVKETDYILVMVSNQDGLGTASFPESDFWPAHNKMLKAFSNEGIDFEDVYIDRSFPEDNLPSRKPGTAMLSKYIYGPYDLGQSYVIGDRLSDLALARNLGCRSIYFSNDKLEEASLCSSSWEEVYRYLVGRERIARVNRQTTETDVSLVLNLDNNTFCHVDTGLKFLDHMLEQLVRHGGMGLNLSVRGDLDIDEHHTMEDTAIVLGQAIRQAIGTKKGIERYAFVLPMDDCLAQVAIDLGGRPWINWSLEFRRERIGDVPTEMFYHFFKSFSDHAQCNLDIRCEGENEHHKIESVFKAFARTLRNAVRKTDDYRIPSTKGIL